MMNEHFQPDAASGPDIAIPDPASFTIGKRKRRSLWSRLYRKLTLRKQRRAWMKRRGQRKAMEEIAKFPKHPDAPRHQLPGRLVVSMTSYPARFPSLHLTIKSLLDQTVRPDHIVLWVAHGDLDALPDSVASLQSDQFLVRTCDDMRSFKKILPSLGAYPDSFIVIVDDDTYYPDHWLAGLLAAYDPEDPSIVCYRAHRLTYMPDGRLAPYRDWDKNSVGDRRNPVCRDLLPTGNGGVLYPPGSLPPETTDLALIRKLSPTSDDVWLFFMWRKNGWSIRRVPGPRRQFYEWPESQDQSLTALHATGKKDEHLQDMSDYFGIP